MWAALLGALVGGIVVGGVDVVVKRWVERRAYRIQMYMNLLPPLINVGSEEHPQRLGIGERGLDLHSIERVARLIGRDDVRRVRHLVEVVAESRTASLETSIRADRLDTVAERNAVVNEYLAREAEIRERFYAAAKDYERVLERKLG